MSSDATLYGLVKIDQAAKILGYSVGHTRRLFLEGKIPGYKPMGRKGAIIFSAAELRTFVESARIPTKKEISEQASEILNSLSKERKAKTKKNAMKVTMLAKAVEA